MLVSSLILRFTVPGGSRKFFPSVEETIGDLIAVIGPKLHSLSPYFRSNPDFEILVYFGLNTRSQSSKFSSIHSRRFSPSVEATFGAFLDLRVVMGPKSHSLSPY